MLRWSDLPDDDYDAEGEAIEDALEACKIELPDPPDTGNRIPGLADNWQFA